MHQGVGCADSHEIFGLISETQARFKPLIVDRPQRVGKSIRPRKCKPSTYSVRFAARGQGSTSVRNEASLVVIFLHPWGFDVISKTYVDRQLGKGAPVILDVSRSILPAVVIVMRRIHRIGSEDPQHISCEA